ncbi:antirestriction protein, partial [Providencia stuartii]|nr:antirestriction protein [Providencia stuartii]
MVYSIWSFKTESSVLVEYFYQLRDYAMQHPEQAQIFRLIDWFISHGFIFPSPAIFI